MPDSQLIRDAAAGTVSRENAMLLALFVLGQPTPTKAIVELLTNNGFRQSKQWNASQILSRSKGNCIRLSDGWALTHKGQERLSDFGLISTETDLRKTTKANLAKLVSSELDPQTQVFLAEVIRAFEHNLFRSAVVLSWVAAVHQIKFVLHRDLLTDFNAEALRRDQKWKQASNLDGISRCKESEILEICQALGLLSKDVKTALKACLDRRNSCGHPNDFELAEATVAHHIEILILNVFNRLR